MKNGYVIRNSIIAALGGLLFGFDTAVISGAEKSVQELFQLDGFAHGFTVAVALIGTIVGTIVAGKPADRFGRKKLLLIGSIGMIFFLAMVANVLFSDSDTGIWIIIYLIGFIAFFAFSQGAVIWVFISEIFPNKVRAKGQALGSFTHWLMAAIVSWLFPMIAESGKNGGGIAFIIFSAFMLIQLIVVYKIFPETKAKSLEAIQKEMLRE